MYYSQISSNPQIHFGKHRPPVYYIEAHIFIFTKLQDKLMETNNNKEKPARCESVLHCKATATLKAAIKAELDEEDKPLEELLGNAEDQK